MKAFTREGRYTVFKIKDLGEEQLELVERVQRELPTLRDCVVVESDWPEYEKVWKMIEDRFTGSSVSESEHTVEMLKLLLDSSKDQHGEYVSSVLVGKIRAIISYLEN